VNSGLPRPVARRALTGQPPQAFGLPANTAKLAVGEPADFVVWDGDPIDTASKPIAVVAQGQRVIADPEDEEPKKRPTPARAQPAPTRRGRGE
jgi:imidazolonepropionase-like amidohydrolase